MGGHVSDVSFVNEGMENFDHRPIIVDTTYYGGTWTGTSNIGRRFEARWLQEPTVDESVKVAWNKAKESGQATEEMLGEVHAYLHTWDRKHLKPPRKRIDKLKSK
jgi:hypothetical protein